MKCVFGEHFWFSYWNILQKKMSCVNNLVLFDDLIVLLLYLQLIIIMLFIYCSQVQTLGLVRYMRRSYFRDSGFLGTSAVLSTLRFSAFHWYWRCLGFYWSINVIINIITHSTVIIIIIIISFLHIIIKNLKKKKKTPQQQLGG